MGLTGLAGLLSGVSRFSRARACVRAESMTSPAVVLVPQVSPPQITQIAPWRAVSPVEKLSADHPPAKVVEFHPDATGI